jgi:hypothetical protein
MTDNNNAPDDMIEIDGDHPWIQAALNMYPGPVQSTAKFDAVELPNPVEGSAPMRAAMLTIIDPTGVKTVFLPPKALVSLMEQAGGIFDFWDEEKSKQQPSILIADKNMEAAAKRAADAAQNMRAK